MRATSKRSLGMLLMLVFGLAGCSRHEPPAPAMAPVTPTTHSVAPADDELSMILPDLMDLSVDPAAGVLFAAAGQHGWNDWEPRTEEAWQAVGDAASQLMRTSDTLAKPALARARADWLQWAEAMREGAAAAGAAARRHDPRSLYAAGVQVRASCQACHARHASQITEPLALRVPR